MPDLTGEQFVTLALALLTALGGGAGAVWQFAVRPKERKVSELERAQSEAKEAREALHNFVLARITQAEKERDAAISRAEVALTSTNILSDLVKELTKVVNDGSRSSIEEIRSVRGMVETMQRSMR